MKYFCSNNGKAISTDLNTPGDFLKTLENVSSGDIIYLFPGEYLFDKTIHINCSNIEITNYTQTIFRSLNEVIFNFKNIPYVCNDYDYKKTKEYINNGNGLVIHGNNIKLSDIKIKFAAFRGLTNFGSFNIFDNIETSYNCDCGHHQAGGDNTIINCSSHHNFDYRFVKNGKFELGFNSDGFGDKMHSNNGNTYINCCAFNNGDDGFDFFQRETPQDHPTILKHCTSSYNSINEIDISLNERLKDDPTFNKFDPYHYPCNNNGNGFKLGGIHHSSPEGYKNYHNVKLDNCIALLNKHDGISLNHNSGYVTLDNCISSYNNRYNFALNNSEETITMTNCFSTPTYHNMLKNIVDNYVKHAKVKNFNKI